MCQSFFDILRSDLKPPYDILIFRSIAYENHVVSISVDQCPRGISRPLPQKRTGAEPFIILIKKYNVEMIFLVHLLPSSLIFKNRQIVPAKKRGRVCFGTIVDKEFFLWGKVINKITATVVIIKNRTLEAMLLEEERRIFGVRRTPNTRFSVY